MSLDQQDEVLKNLLADFDPVGPSSESAALQSLRLQADESACTIALLKKQLEDTKLSSKKKDKSQAHVPGTLDIHACQCLTHSVRTPKEGDAIFAVDVSTQKTYVVHPGTVDSIDAEFVYVAIKPAFTVGTSTEPESKRPFAFSTNTLSSGMKHGPTKRWLTSMNSSANENPSPANSPDTSVPRRMTLLNVIHRPHF